MNDVCGGVRCLNELPTGWIHVQFEEAVDIVSDRGFRIKQKNYLPSGITPVVDQGEGLIGGYTNDTEARIETPVPVIVFGDHTRRFKFVSFPFAVGADGVKLFHPVAIYDSKFLFHQLGTVDLEDRGYGRHYQHLRKELLVLPPFHEQIRIVEKLEELLSDLDAGVAELKAAQKKLAQYRQSLLKAAVEGTLTAEWRKENQPKETGAQLLGRILKERRSRWENKQLAKFQEQSKIPPKGWQDKYPEPVKPDTSDLPELPVGWVWSTVDQCAFDEGAITDGPFGSNLKTEHYKEVGPRVIRLKNIGDGVFVDSQAHISHEHYNKLLKHAVCAGDLIVAMLGEFLPRACIAPDDIEPAIVKADCARIRVNQNALLPTLLNACLNSQPTRERVSGLVKGIGRPRINLGHVRSISVPLPPQDEQRAIELAITQGVEVVQQLITAIDLGQRQASAQRKNILKAAFSGQLVPQDPNDEPASVLLERIRAGRAEIHKAVKPRIRGN